MNKNILNVRRGESPLTARTRDSLDEDVAVLQRRIGKQTDSAATVEDLKDLGLVVETSQGTVASSVPSILGAQSLFNFIRKFK